MIEVTVREFFRDLEVRVGDKKIGRVRVFGSGCCEAYQGTDEASMTWVSDEGRATPRSIAVAVNRVLSACGYGHNKGGIKRDVVRRIP